MPDLPIESSLYLLYFELDNAEIGRLGISEDIGNFLPTEVFREERIDDINDLFAAFIFLSESSDNDLVLSFFVDVLATVRTRRRMLWRWLRDDLL